jgi:hypothetical protein
VARDIWSRGIGKSDEFEIARFHQFKSKIRKFKSDGRKGEVPGRWILVIELQLPTRSRLQFLCGRPSDLNFLILDLN